MMKNSWTLFYDPNITIFELLDILDDASSVFEYKVENHNIYYRDITEA